MVTEVSKIEAIIENGIAEETAKSIADIEKDIEGKTQAAINRINGVYASAIKTLEQLELTDAGIFEFFQKTDGNIRVAEFVTKSYAGDLNVEEGGWRVFENQNPIYLKRDTKYKIIVMAMEIKNTETTKEVQK